MIPIGAATIVMRPHVQLEPQMLRHVVEERRPQIADDEHGDERGKERHHDPAFRTSSITLTWPPF